MVWVWIVLVPVSHFVFTLFRAANAGNSRDLGLVEIWANGFAWLFVGASLAYLLRALVPAEQ